MAEARRSAKTQTGDLKGARVLVAEARFYDDIADALLHGAKRVLEEAQVEFDVVTVPGALELPAAISMGLDHDYDAAVALGCVIRGDTIHFEIVSNESARGLMNLAVEYAFPVGNGVITVDNEDQAWERAKHDRLDKGGDAARAALAMLRLKRSFDAMESK